MWIEDDARMCVSVVYTLFDVCVRECVYVCVRVCMCVRVCVLCVCSSEQLTVSELLLQLPPIAGGQHLASL